MDSTNPDLSAFAARGGKLVMMENMADYAQSPYAGIGYYESVVNRLGRGSVDGFMRLYTAPGVDHVGTGGPANVDMLSALVDWVERGKAPDALVATRFDDPKTRRKIVFQRPVCVYPAVPRYVGGPQDAATSFACVTPAPAKR